MVTKIISGGQTGADQGALAAAAQLGLETGGWMPRGWLTENSPDPSLADLHGMREHASAEYRPRTFANVLEADGTLWVGSANSHGFACTMKAVRRYNYKPFIANPTPADLRAWVELNNIKTLNVAGNRESRAPGTYLATRDLLLATFL